MTVNLVVIVSLPSALVGQKAYQSFIDTYGLACSNVQVHRQLRHCVLSSVDATLSDLQPLILFYFNLTIILISVTPYSVPTLAGADIKQGLGSHLAWIDESTQQ